MLQSIRSTLASNDRIVFLPSWETDAPSRGASSCVRLLLSATVISRKRRMATVLPAPLRTLFSHYPLYTYPPTASPYQAQPIRTPALWVRPPRTSSSSSNVLSSDVECLKWQAYLALKFSQTANPASIAVRWDVAPSGAVEGRLPNLHVPFDTLPPSLHPPSSLFVRGAHSVLNPQPLLCCCCSYIMELSSCSLPIVG